LACHLVLQLALIFFAKGKGKTAGRSIIVIILLLIPIFVNKFIAGVLYNFDFFVYNYLN